jgi:hypothetical protein
MRLCKRCNKEAHKYISKSEMETIKKEMAVMEKAKQAKKEEEEKKEEEKAEEAADKEGPPEEGGESPEEATSET